MLSNTLKVAIRNLWKHRGYAAINVAGLGLGMACSLLIFLYVQDELRYDRFHSQAEDLYRVNWDFDWNGGEGVGPGTPPPLAATFAAEIPEIEAATRLYPVSRMVVRRGDRFFNEPGIVAVDSSFFDLFDFELLAGDPRTALSAPNSVVLTEATARRYFGAEPALGKDLLIGDEKLVFGRYPYRNAFKVTGVVRTPPAHSHIQFDLLTSMASHPEVAHFDWSWVWMQVTTYVKLRPGATTAAVEAKVPAVLRAHAADAFRRIGFSYDELTASGGRFDFVLQPFTDVYLGSGATGNRLGPASDRLYVRLFSTVAVFVLLIACINFTNLATARSAMRAREIGVRKVLGSRRGLLVAQFLVEAVVLAVLALPLAFALVEALVGPFNQLSGKALAFRLFEPAWLPAVLVLLPVLVGLVAGSYPAIYLSALRPVQVFKGAFRPGARGRGLRNGLVVFQFALTIGLIACTLVVQQQMDFVREADLGFDREGVVVVSNENGRLGDRVEAFKERLKRHPGILHASVSTGIPPYYGFEDGYEAEGKRDVSIGLVSYLIDEDFVPTLGIEIVEGRGFSRDFPADAQGVVLNEAAVKAFGWTDPIGKTVFYPGGDGTFEVVGVMKDFNFLTLRAPIAPFALFHQASRSYEIPESFVVVRLRPGAYEAGVRSIEAEWRALAPDMPFEYHFLDEGLAEAYRAERRLGGIFLAFSILTVFIACMGLLGLASFAAAQRTKEIGIRKVMGASVPRLVALLSKDFLKLVVAAFVLAVPVAGFAVQRWLEDFAYHVDLRPGVFVLAGALAVAVALATVAYQALRAALADPVESLRYE